jgi:hypothetical protein
MSVDLWISVALAIPLAIVANIVTPPIQKRIDSRLAKGNERKAAKRAERRRQQLVLIKKELSEVEALQSDKANLTHHYLDALLRVAFYGAFGALYGAIFPFLGEIGGWSGGLGVLGRLGGQAVALITAMLIFFTCARAARLARRSRDFQKYKAETEKLIAELEGDA